MKLSKFLHLWLSVPFGVFIFLICFSGATLVFENELTDLFKPERTVEPCGAPLPLSELVPTALAPLKDSTAYATSVDIPASIFAPYRVNVEVPRRCTLLVDPFSGQMLGEAVRPPFFKAMHSLHGSLLLGRPAEGGIPWGSILVGTSTLIMLIVLITGLILWWPRSRRGVGRAFRISTQNGPFAFWFSLHDAGGMYASLFLMAMCVTGLTWSFDWFSRGYYALLGAPAETAKTAPVPASVEQEKPDYELWDKQLNWLFEDRFGKALTVSNGKIKKKLGAFGNTRAADILHFDEDGHPLDTDHYADLPRREKIKGWTGSFHTGTWGGFITRLLYMIAALVGASLPVTGYYIWIRRLLRQRD